MLPVPARLHCLLIQIREDLLVHKGELAVVEEGVGVPILEYLEVVDLLLLLEFSYVWLFFFVVFFNFD